MPVAVGKLITTGAFKFSSYPWKTRALGHSPNDELEIFSFATNEQESIGQ